MLWQSRQYAGKLSGCRVQVEMQLAAFGCQRRIEVIPNGTEVQAVNSLRSETGYRHWENDLTPDDTPYEAGMGFGVKLYKGNFVGRNALIVQKARPLTKRMSQIVLKDSKPKLYGNEPVYRDGKNVGELTSGTYVHREDGAAVDLAWLDADWEVEVQGQMVPASVSFSSPYDPKNERVRM